MAPITINLTAAQATRVQAALEAARADVGGPPITVADAKVYLVTKLKQVVNSHERRLREQAAEAADQSFDPT